MLKSRTLAVLALAVSACSPRSSIVDNHDGTYSRPRPAGVDESSTQHRGALTWSYVGQAKYSFAPKPVGPHSYVITDDPPEALDHQLRRLIREDADGSLWQVSDVDLTSANELLARRAALSPEVARGLTVSDPARPGTSPVAHVGEVAKWTPNSWSRGNCDNRGTIFATDDDNHYFDNDDDRVQVDPLASTRRKAMVHVYSSVGSCTGTILRGDWVLTAGHCIFDENGDLIDRDDMSVVRVDGVDSSPYGLSNRVYVSTYKSGGWDPKDDWALLKLDRTLTSPYYDMDISSASDSTITGLNNVANYAFPSYAPLCTRNIADDMYMNTVEGLGSVYNRKVNIKMDGGPGHSGSPVFYCPDGVSGSCSGTDKGFVLVVWSGWNGFETTMVGPKGPAFHDAATTAMDTY
jgi:V8-like Glu-specific endopeptidase